MTCHYDDYINWMAAFLTCLSIIFYHIKIMQHGYMNKIYFCVFKNNWLGKICAQHIPWQHLVQESIGFLFLLSKLLCPFSHYLLQITGIRFEALEHCVQNVHTSERKKDGKVCCDGFHLLVYYCTIMLLYCQLLLCTAQAEQNIYSS